MCICSKPTTEILELFVKSVQREQLKHQDNNIDLALVSLLLTLTYFTPFSSALIVDFEQVNVWFENS